MNRQLSQTVRKEIGSVRAKHISVTEFSNLVEPIIAAMDGIDPNTRATINFLIYEIGHIETLQDNSETLEEKLGRLWFALDHV